MFVHIDNLLPIFSYLVQTLGLADVDEVEDAFELAPMARVTSCTSAASCALSVGSQTVAMVPLCKSMLRTAIASLSISGL